MNQKLKWFDSFNTLAGEHKLEQRGIITPRQSRLISCRRADAIIAGYSCFHQSFMRQFKLIKLP
jgi:hypothetical protein